MIIRENIIPLFAGTFDTNVALLCRRPFGTQNCDGLLSGGFASLQPPVHRMVAPPELMGRWQDGGCCGNFRFLKRYNIKGLLLLHLYEFMTATQIEENKRRIKSLIRSTGREGIENVIDYLDKNNFFELPSSLTRHHNWEGGLAQHCLGVYDRLCATGENLPSDSRILVSMLHDICKARKIYKDNHGKWRTRKDEELHIPGHGYRSVRLLEKLGLKLTPEEKGAIRWHMGGWKIGERPKEEIRDFFVTKKSPLWRLHLNADRYDASHHPAKA